MKGELRKILRDNKKERKKINITNDKKHKHKRYLQVEISIVVEAPVKHVLVNLEA